MFETTIKQIQPDEQNKEKDWQSTYLVIALGLAPKNRKEDVKASETTIYRTFMLFVQHPGKQYTIEEVCDIIGRSRPSMTLQLAKLVRRHLVKKEKVPVAHHITSEGVEWERDYKKNHYSLNGENLVEAVKAHNVACRRALEAIETQSKIVDRLM